MDDAQVVIPDLDELDASIAALDASLGEPEWPPAIRAPQTPGPWDERLSPLEEALPPRPRPRLGSAASDNEPRRMQGASSSTLDYFHSPTRTHERSGSSLSFPKKSSFANLRAAIKGQPTTPGVRDALDPLSPFASDADSVTSTRRLPRVRTFNDISAVSSGLAQATGMRRRPHAKSGSASSGAEASASPVRMRHAHKKSQLSELSLDAYGASPGTSVADRLSPTLIADDGARVHSTLSEQTAALFPASAASNPFESALHVVLSQFAAVAAAALDAVLTTTHDVDAVYALFPVSESRAAFDDLLLNIEHFARHNSELVVRQLLTWRADVLDQPLRWRSSESDVLARRRTLAVTYLACRALTAAVPRTAAPDDPALDQFVTVLFQLLHLCSVDRESERGTLPRLHTTLQQQCFDVVARLLGELSRVWFVALVRPTNAVSPPLASSFFRSCGSRTRWQRRATTSCSPRRRSLACATCRLPYTRWRRLRTALNCAPSLPSSMHTAMATGSSAPLHVCCARSCCP